MTITPEDLVRREVHYCASYLVSTLATGYGAIAVNSGINPHSRASGIADLTELCGQAAELCYPVPDYEEAAIEAGWSNGPNAWPNVPNDENYWGHPDRVESAGNYTACLTAQKACEHDGIEPHEREIFEHWIISDWLADKLEAKGEKVDKDFAGLTIWARTTTGQGIASDGVIEQICAELNAPPAPVWDDCKIAFGVESRETAESFWGEDAKHLPKGWKLNEIDASGARVVAVFRINGSPNRDDAEQVRRLLDRTPA